MVKLSKISGKLEFSDSPLDPKENIFKQSMIMMENK